MVGSTIKVVATAESGNTFESEETAEVEEEEVVLSLIDVDQISANKIVVTFDGDAETEGVTKDDITISQIEDGVATLTVPVKDIEWTSEDGTEATLTLAQALTDDATYEVSYEESDVEFIASVGDVASVVVLTSTAQQNVETPIEFMLLDENGTDVTSTVKISETITVSVEGDYSSFNPSATKPSITMDTVDAEATVTVTYNSNKTGAEDIVGEGEVICIEPEAVVGEGIFKAPGTALKTYSDATQCAKFYTGTPDSVATVEEDGTKVVYFCALDEKGDVIPYSNYDAESSNDDIVNVTMVDNKDTGKICAFEITGIVEGSANINVKATNNGKDTFYRVPVVVTEKGVLASLTVTASRAPISNAIDEAYYGQIKVSGKDTNGNAVSFDDDDISYTLIDSDKKGGDLTALDVCEGIDTGKNTANQHGFRLGTTVYPDDATAKTANNNYTAWGDKGGTYTVEVEATKDGVSITKKVNIKVDALNESAWYGKKGADTVYQIELGSATIDSASTAKTQTTTARLYATVGGKFAGYVRDYGAIGTGADANTLTVYESETTGAVAGTLTFTTEYADVGNDVLNGVAITVNAEDVGTQGTTTYKVGGTVHTGDVLTIGDATYTLTAAEDDASKAAAKLKGEIDNVAAITDVYTVSVTTDTITLEQKVGSTTAFPASSVTGTDATTTITKTVVTTGVAPETPDDTVAATITDATGAIECDWRGDVDAEDFELAITSAAAKLDKDNDFKLILSAISVTDTPAGNPAASTFNDTYTWGAQTATADKIGYGSIQTNLSSQISDITYGIKNGNLYNVDGNLYYRTKSADAGTGWKDKKTDFSAYDGIIEIDTNRTVDDFSYYVPSAPVKYDYYYAAPGTYTVTFNYLNYLGKTQEKTIGLKVTNSFFTPSVDYTDLVVDTLDISDIREVLKTDVDMNCNVSAYDSIPEDAALISTLANDATGIGTTAEEINDKITVKFIPVVEDGVVFYTSLNKTFKTE